MRKVTINRCLGLKLLYPVFKNRNILIIPIQIYKKTMKIYYFGLFHPLEIIKFLSALFFIGHFGDLRITSYFVFKNGNIIESKIIKIDSPFVYFF